MIKTLGYAARSATATLGAAAYFLHDLRDIDYERATDGKQEFVCGAGDEHREWRHLRRGLNDECQHHAAEDDAYGQPRCEMSRQFSPRFLLDPVERQAEAGVLQPLEEADQDE